MPLAANQSTVSANGTYTFDPQPVGGNVLLERDITAGTATITPGYLSLSGAFKPCLDAVAGGTIVQGDGGDDDRVGAHGAPRVTIRTKLARGTGAALVVRARGELRP